MKSLFTSILILAFISLNLGLNAQNLSKKEVQKFKFELDGVQQKMIIPWADEKKLDEYREEGGEDWFWFVSDIYLHFEEYPVENLQFKVDLPEGISDADMKKLAKKHGNAELYFGYYLFDGNKVHFIQHNDPDEVLKEIYRFYNIEMPEIVE
ncbi:MAG: hypothetical protein PHE56_08370 [Bacteroidales bacterium]|nr:hypothetical protein [Bacteroidales bacterium]